MFTGKLHITSMKSAFDGLDTDSDGVLDAKEQVGIRNLMVKSELR